MKRRRLAGLAATGAAVAAAFAFLHPAPSAWIVAYRHDGPGAATLVLAGAPRAAFALSGEAIPARFEPTSIDETIRSRAWDRRLPVERSRAGFSGSFRLTFGEDASAAASEQNHLVVFYPLGCAWLPAAVVQALQDTGVCRNAGHIEIIRQSPAFLKTRYGFDKPDGYSIAGRRTVELPRAAGEKQATVIHGSPVPVLALPHIPGGIAARIGDGPRELQQAARLIAFMNEQPVRVGPVNAAPEAGEALARLEAIRSGESAVQCQSFRDIWLELAVRVPGIERVRSVAAYNYYPPFRDLVTFSHALAELYVAGEGRWILIDPWMGFALRHGGRFLSVAELNALRRDQRQEIEIVPLVDRVRRYSVAADGTKPPIESTVADIAMPMQSRFVDGRYEFGYLDYFEAIAYGAEYRRAPAAARPG